MYQWLSVFRVVGRHDYKGIGEGCFCVWECFVYGRNGTVLYSGCGVPYTKSIHMLKLTEVYTKNKVNFYFMLT